MRNEMFSNVQCFVKGDIVYALGPSATRSRTWKVKILHGLHRSIGYF